MYVIIKMYLWRKEKSYDKMVTVGTGCKHDSYGVHPVACRQLRGR
jgi:hypothetical protein